LDQPWVRDCEVSGLLRHRAQATRRGVARRHSMYVCSVLTEEKIAAIPLLAALRRV
jgi:hypothetical protein